ncbi:MAG TPA: mercuric reductase [Candidatus Limnocylindria bacterium]|nr:mercuric reductase [Candidatus Limnocylindria bacterium]
MSSPQLLPADRHNAELLAQVHPPDWRNPAPAPRYNLVVIGGGTAGLVTAAGAAGLGAKVALVERHLLGGDCLNYGCVPSKTLLRAARAAADVRDAARFGVHLPGEAVVDFAAVMERVRSLRAGISHHDSAARFRDLGVDVFQGDACFTGADVVEVAGARLHFRNAVIATGARALVPEIPGLREAGFLTNETVWSLTALPRRLAILGGGPIGCELAQAFGRLGSEVTLLHNKNTLLDKEDADAAALVQTSLARDSVEICCAADVTAVEGRSGTAQTVHYRRQDGSGALVTASVVVDAILVAAGRRPNVTGLGLESVGVAFDAREGVRVDDRLRTTNRHIFAAGDVCSRHMFTHAADFAARTVIQNALFLGRKKASALNIPRATYTDPEVAVVGLTEREAATQGVAVTKFTRELKDVDRALTEGETEGFVKILVAAGSDRIVGATIVARHAGDLISEISIAMAGDLGLGRLASVIHPYPTHSEAIRQCGDAYNRTRLTPTVRLLFARWLGWRR